MNVKIKRNYLAALTVAFFVLVFGCKKDEGTNISPTCEGILKYGIDNPDLLAGFWQLECTIDNKEIITSPFESRLNIWLNGGYVFGVVNGWYGRYEVAQNTIDFNDPNAIVTAIAGYQEGEEKWEDIYFSRIERISCYSVNENQLFLLYKEKSGENCIMIFKKAK